MKWVISSIFCILIWTFCVMGSLSLSLVQSPDKEDNKQTLNKEVEEQCLQSNN